MNSREIASLVWLAALFILAARRSPKLWKQLGGVVKAALDPKIVAFAGLVAVNTALAVGILWWTEAWTLNQVKPTLIWFAFTGLPLGALAVMRRDAAPARSRLLRETARITILIEFLIGVYVFPLWAELIVVPFVGYIAIEDVLAEYGGSEPSRPSRKQAMLGIVVIGAAVWRIVTDFQSLAKTDSLRDLLVAPALSLAFLPCLFLLAKLSDLEYERARRV